MQPDVPPDARSFLDRFFAFGDRPGTETYLSLFHPDATLFDAGMERPITVPEIPEHIEGILKLVPDFRMVPERWRFRERTLFVEARNQATVGRSGVRWRSVYCVDLEGDRVIRGRRYYDRRALYALLDPALPALSSGEPVAGDAPEVADPLPGPEPLVRAYADAWRTGDTDALARLFREDATSLGPEMPRPLARTELAHHVGTLHAVFSNLDLELLQWAGDDDLAFVELRLTAEVLGQPFALGMVDRLDLAGGLVLAARAYFDTLELATRFAAATEES